MYTVLITQEVQCENKDHAYGLWAGNDYEGEAIDIKVFQDGELLDEESIQSEFNRTRECAKTHLQGFKEVFAL